MPTIAICQLKGGVGRTTIACNLATGLGAVLVDADLPQATASAWHALREKHTPALVAVQNHRQLLAWHEQLGDRVAVVDAPPRVAEVTRALLVLCDLIIVPVSASVADLWAAQDLLATVDDARGQGARVEVRLLWNKLRANTRSGKEMPGQVQRELGVPALRSTLGYRVAYSDSFAEGLSVLEYRDKKAKKEMSSLVREVRRLL